MAPARVRCATGNMADQRETYWSECGLRRWLGKQTHDGLTAGYDQCNAPPGAEAIGMLLLKNKLERLFCRPCSLPSPNNLSEKAPPLVPDQHSHEIRKRAPEGHPDTIFKPLRHIRSSALGNHPGAIFKPSWSRAFLPICKHPTKLSRRILGRAAPGAKKTASSLHKLMRSAKQQLSRPPLHGSRKNWMKCARGLSCALGETAGPPSPKREQSV